MAIAEELNNANVQIINLEPNGDSQGYKYAFYVFNMQSPKTIFWGEKKQDKNQYIRNL